jgi:hypothetical protein
MNAFLVNPDMILLELFTHVSVIAREHFMHFVWFTVIGATEAIPMRFRSDNEVRADNPGTASVSRP